MNRKICVLDTETVGTSSQRVYNLAYAIVDTKSWEVLAEREFLVAGVFGTKSYQTSQFITQERYAFFQQLVERIGVTKFAQIDQIMSADFAKHNVSMVSAYNAGFDLSAMANTASHFGITSILQSADLPVLCLWKNAVDLLTTQRTYRKLAAANNWVTESGRYWKSDAETMFRYISRDFQYVHPHTALEDVRAEVAILRAILRQKRGITLGVVRPSYPKR